MKLTEQKQYEYVKAPCNCPYCGEDDIIADHFDPESLSRSITCNTCVKEWIEIFQLIGIEEIAD